MKSEQKTSEQICQGLRQAVKSATDEMQRLREENAKMRTWLQSVVEQLDDAVLPGDDDNVLDLIGDIHSFLQRA